MGGAASGVCATYVIRPNVNNVRACLHSKPKYDWLITNSGQSFFFKPINGVLSTLDTSAGTHSRYGAVDVEGDGYSKDELYRVARLVRDRNILAFPRLWKNTDGSSNWHIHMADADCPHMAVTLAAQFKLFGQGYDALVGNHPDPLGGYRKAEIMAAFNARVPVIKPPAPTAGLVPLKDWHYPYTYKAGWYPYPGRQGASYYGPSKPGTAWYSGKVGGGTKVGTGATGGLSLPWVRGHIGRIQRLVGVTADGRYGDKTVAAVKRWQAAHKLPADGIVGPRTWAAMAKSKGQ